MKWLKASAKWIVAAGAVLAGLYYVSRANKFEKRYRARSEEVDKLDASEAANAVEKAKVHQATAHVEAARSQQARTRAEARIKKLKDNDHQSMADLVARHNGGLRNGSGS